jgi:hypothetical protein
MRLDSEGAKIMTHVGRHEPQFVELLGSLRSKELETLALCNPETFSTQKGRVQMLTEILQQLRPDTLSK